MRKNLMRLKEARQYLEELGCPLAEQTCYGFICSGTFAKGEKVGKFWMFEPSAIKEWAIARCAPKSPRPFNIKISRREAK